MNKKPITIPISSEHITLGQFLKFANVISTGGEAKKFLSENTITINGENDNRRGRKLRKDDVVTILGVNYLIE